MAAELETRAAAGKQASLITFKGRPMDPGKIRRYLKDASRKESQHMLLEQNESGQLSGTHERIRSFLPFGNRIFLKWNMPYGILQQFQAHVIDHSSPINFAAATPSSDVMVTTPIESASSPQDAPTPTKTLIKKKQIMDRTRLFVQGRHDQLIGSMDKEERMRMSKWLYEYWFYSFKTAKTWGRGPKYWTADSLDFDRFSQVSLSRQPGTSSHAAASASHRFRGLQMPTNLCRWLIHLRPDSQEKVDQWEEQIPMTDPTASQDPRDESTWTPWPSEWREPPLQTRMRDALEHNDFSTLRVESLPVAVPQIAMAAQRSHNQLLEEALGFSIMSRNRELVVETWGKILEEKIDLSSLYPLHIATSYLDGYKVCCDVLDTLLYPKDHGLDVWSMYTNDLGHTVLDNLMISILKSHTSITPGTINTELRHEPRFVGEEIDICGHWDADSESIRALFAEGHPGVPFEWKHKFCHTSIQTICHCIVHMVQHISVPRFNTGSGLYLRQCFHCGTKLQLYPLHTLVVTAYHLASSGCKDEDLFGLVTCLLCLISHGVDSRSKANVSLNALLQFDGPENQCDHQELSPSELAEQFGASLQNYWTPKVRTGWKVFQRLLSICENEFESHRENDTEEEDEGSAPSNEEFIGAIPPEERLFENHNENHKGRFFGNRTDIATLWAAVQAEFLTYRRLDESSNWTSDYFDMQLLLKRLERGETVSVKLVDDGLLKTHCTCGHLPAFNFDNIATLHDATTEYIANLDVWQRATYSELEDKYW
ncbi:hypothetical protein BDV95DRAFT_332278 [Massariosphaeria phaeospora]|uniref:Clr5 domain-containing protein n=1 Tax=Massariosphaeria phaeospora TaxID=100035 RepID=A0A7C8ME45_9PLEO|nr:hypothetical protein BDV95DRAFT_332278 [Massariosphaeria phaeospora]